MSTCRGLDTGECHWHHCPQWRDMEPEASGRACPLARNARAPRARTAETPDLRAGLADRLLEGRRQDKTLQQLADQEGMSMTAVWTALARDPRYNRHEHRELIGRPRTWTDEDAARVYALACEIGSITEAAKRAGVRYPRACRMIVHHRAVNGLPAPRQVYRYGG